MSRPIGQRPERFAGIDYSATPAAEPQRSRERPTPEVGSPGVEIMPAGDSGGVAPVPRASRALADLPTRSVVNRATAAPSAGRVSQALGGAAAIASRSSNPKVALAGRAVGGAVAVNNLAAQHGVDLPGASKKVAAAIAEKVKNRPRSEHSLFHKVGQAFSRKGDVALPTESENAAGYASRLVGGELEERKSAQVAEADTAGMAEFVAAADEVDERIIDAEVISVDSETQRPLTDAEVAAGGGAGTGGVRVSRIRDGHPVSKELALLNLENQFDELDNDHQLSQGGAGAYGPPEQKGPFVAGPGKGQRALGEGHGPEREPHPETVEFEPVGGPGDYDIETNAMDVMSRLRAERGDEPITLEDLRKTMRMLQRDAAEQLEKNERNDNPLSGENIKEAASESLKKMRGRHDAYAGMMVMGCLAPLRQGVDAESVTAVATTAAVMWCLSPAFRDTVGSFTDKISKAADKKVETAAENARAGSFFKNDAQRERVEKRVKENLNVHNAEKARMMDSDENHVPRTTDSAAQQLVMLNANAYAAMREKDADPVQVMRKYAAMKDGFNRECQMDGLDVSKVNARARWLVGNAAQHDQSVKTRFSEISHGTYVMTEPKQVRLGTGETTHRWDGSWASSVDPTQTISSEAEFFTPRMPQPLSGHEESIGRMMSADIGATMQKFNGATKAEAMDELKDKLVGYSAGWANQTHSMAGQYSGPAKAAGSMHSAIQAMKDDGFEPDDIRRVVDVNVTATIDSLIEHYPREMSQFEKKYPMDTWVAEAGEFQSSPEKYLGKVGTVTATPVPHQSIPINEKDMPEHERIHRQRQRAAAVQEEQARAAQPGAGENTSPEVAATTGGRPADRGEQNRSQPDTTAHQTRNDLWADNGNAEAGDTETGRSGKQRDYADEQRQRQAAQEKEAAVVAAERARQAEASSGHRGRTSTPAQERVAASHNNDYSTRAEHQVDLNLDDSSTPEQEDLYNRGGRNRAQQNRRVRSNQAFIQAEEQRRQQERDAASRQAQRQNEGFSRSTQAGPEKGMDGPDL